MSSPSAPKSPLTRSNMSVVLDFLPSCMPLPFGAAALNDKSAKNSPAACSDVLIRFVLLSLIRVVGVRDSCPCRGSVSRIDRCSGDSISATSRDLFALHL